MHPQVLFIASVLLQRTGQSVTKSALDHLLSTFKEKQAQINSKVGKSQNLAALELITFLKSQSNVTFVALWDDPNSNLFCLCKASNKDKETYEYNCQLMVEADGKSSPLDSHLVDPSEEFKIYLKKTCESFCLPHNERLLLGCVWTTEYLHQKLVYTLRC